MTREEITQKISRHALEIGYSLGQHAGAIIKMIVNNSGKCPCKRDQTDIDNTCPWPGKKAEIEATGHCKCSLFYADV